MQFKVRSVFSSRVVCFGVLAVLFGLMTAPGIASAEAAVNAAPTGPPSKIQDLLKLVDDPEVRQWLNSHNTNVEAAATPPSTDRELRPWTIVDLWLAKSEAHVKGMIAAVPRVPGELKLAWQRFIGEVEQHGVVRALLFLCFVILLGYGLDWFYSRATAPLLARLSQDSIDPAGSRLKAGSIRLALEIGRVLVFAVGCIGAIHFLHWPPMLASATLAFVLALVATRLARVAGLLLLAPSGSWPTQPERMRLIPMSAAAADFYQHRLVLLAGYFAFGYTVILLIIEFGVSLEVRQVVAGVLELGLLAIAIESVWRAPRSSVTADGIATPPARYETVRRWMLTAAFIVLWLLWNSGTRRVFWTLLVAMVLPSALRLLKKTFISISAWLGENGAQPQPPRLLVAVVGRAIRAGLLLGALAILVSVWQLDASIVGASDNTGARFLGHVWRTSIILLLLDFVWYVGKAWIERILMAPGETSSSTPGSIDEQRRAARLKTLLPILRNFTSTLFVLVAILMVLSTLGLDIGPLLAGAGVFGVAIGFGAQTVVKDIISGAFYLLDDAFRVGEYIQSGEFKGTVESFSLRSVKLRHHRGPVFTVPFSELGAVQNMSRDWVIQKLTVGVGYDTDLAKVKKLIKKVGQELMDDPELAPGIIEPLKMQGIEAFGNYAIEIRMKMTTRPDETQFTTKRRALALIRKTFEENGIHIPLPTVQIAGGGQDAAGAAAGGMPVGTNPAT